LALSAIAHTALLLVLAHVAALSVQKRTPPPLHISLLALQSPQSEQPSTIETQPEATPPMQATPEPTVAPVPQEHPTAIPAAPERLPGAPMLAVGTHGPAGGFYDARGSAQRWDAVRKGGGGIETESAVHAALVWLARYRNLDGSWDAAGFAAQAGVTLIPGEAGAAQASSLINPGVSGLALLAFLAAGNTHREGEFRHVVRQGLRYVRGLQQDDGRFTARLVPGRDPFLMYNQAICTIVLAEACAMTDDASLRPAIRRSIDFIRHTQQSGGGWDYGTARTQRNDTSVTGWVVMALKSAQAAGVDVPESVLFNVIRHFETATLNNGEVVYANTGVGTNRKGLAMVAVGMTARQFLGWPIHCKTLQRQARMIGRFPIRWERIADGSPQTLLESSYYWYYGTIALFQMGGPRWKQWNEHMKQTLLKHQVRDGPMRGSWDPVGLWANTAGRIYATALNTLDLEIYYRYLPLYEAEPLDGAGVLARAARSTHLARRSEALRILRDFDQPVAIAALVEALSDQEPEGRLVAAQSLARQRSRIALPTLLALLREDNDVIRFQALNALQEFSLKGLAPDYIRLLNDPQRYVRQRAAKRLKEWAGDDFGYAADADPATRAAAAGRFRQWWEQNAAAAKLKLEAKVIAIDLKRGLAFVGAGRGQHVAPGDLLAVLRDGRFIALLSAEEAFEDKTIAAILTEHSRADVAKGDTVIPCSSLAE